MAPLVILTILFGVYPAPVLDVTARSVKELVTKYEAAIKAPRTAAGLPTR
jgi:NADH-quinone oxidoreductase subunit M